MIFFYPCGGELEREEWRDWTPTQPFVLSPVMNAAMMVSGLESCAGLLIWQLLQLKASLTQFIYKIRWYPCPADDKDSCGSHSLLFKTSGTYFSVYFNQIYGNAARDNCCLGSSLHKGSHKLKFREVTIPSRASLSPLRAKGKIFLWGPPSHFTHPIIWWKRWLKSKNVQYEKRSCVCCGRAVI